MRVSENDGTPKSSSSIGFSIINHPFWGIPIFLETPISMNSYGREIILKVLLGDFDGLGGVLGSFVTLGARGPKMKLGVFSF